MKTPRPAVERVLDRAHEDDRGCWIFDGAVDRSGYGRVGVGGHGAASTHRVTFEFFRAEIPAGLDLDHLCRNRRCCNPWHLDPVTRAVNVARGNRAAGYGPLIRTHCAHGHEFTPENTRLIGSRRKCRTCERAYDRTRKAKP